MSRPTDLDDQLEHAFEPDAPDLLAWLDHELAETRYDGEDASTTEPPEWEIDGQRTAEWALRRLKRAEGERAEAKALADELRAQAAAYEDAVARRTGRDVEYFTGRLRAFHDRLLAENPKRKTVELPSAKLERRAGGVSAVIEDEAKLIEWLEANDDELLNYKDPSVKRTELKAKYGAKVDTAPGAYHALAVATGEVLPGVSIVRGDATERITWTTPAENTELELEDAEVDQ